MNVRDGFYLIDHPPASSQYRAPRRYVLSGLVAPHTAEGGPAANVARFISTRSDPGSYHELCDPDGTVIPLIPDGWEAFHVATDQHNRHAWGISAAWRSTDFTRPGDPLTDGMLATMAARVRAFAERNGWEPSSARWVDRAEALTIRDAAANGRRSPFIALCAHGTLQPADRSDAWTRHPNRAELDEAFVELVRATPTTPEGPPPVSLDSLTIPNAARPYPLAGAGVEFRAAGYGFVVRWQDATAPGGWTPWAIAGELPRTPVQVDSITARSDEHGRLEVLVWHSSNPGLVYRAWQNVPGGTWDGWLQV